MDWIEAKQCGPLTGELEVPGDKSISHRAAILAGLAAGRTRVKNFLHSEDCLNTLGAMEQMGVKVGREASEFPGRPDDLVIDGVEGQLRAPSKELDCGNSGTGMRLLAGVMAGQNFESKLVGDESLSGRPMGRIMKPLGLMGAVFESLGEKEGCAPLVVRGRELHGIDYELPMASAQVKSSVLLAGLFAQGETVVRQPAVTRDHTERLFRHFGLPLEVDGLKVSTCGGQLPVAKDLTVPGDISSAAFWLVAAALVPGSDLTLKNVGLNPTRDAVIGVLQRMGAQIDVFVTGGEEGEPFGDVRVRAGQLQATDLLAEEVPILIDEIPVLAVAASQAEGVSGFRHAEELRVKETDRIATTVQSLRAMGGIVEEFADGMEIRGKTPLHGAQLDSFGDHRIAMAFLIGGLVASGITQMRGVECIATSYPSFRQQFAGFLG